MVESKSAAEMLTQSLTRLYHLFTYTVNHNEVNSIPLADMEDIGLPYMHFLSLEKMYGLNCTL